MAQLRIIGDEDEVQAILEAMAAVVQLADLGRTGSRYNTQHIRIYGHVQPHQRSAGAELAPKAELPAAVRRLFP